MNYPEPNAAIHELALELLLDVRANTSSPGYWLNVQKIGHTLPSNARSLLQSLLRVLIDQGMLEEQHDNPAFHYLRLTQRGQAAADNEFAAKLSFNGSKPSTAGIAVPLTSEVTSATDVAQPSHSLRGQRTEEIIYARRTTSFGTDGGSNEQTGKLEQLTVLWKDGVLSDSEFMNAKNRLFSYFDLSVS